MSKHMRPDEKAKRCRRKRVVAVSLVLALGLIALVVVWCSAIPEAKPVPVEDVTVGLRSPKPKSGWTNDEDGQRRYYDPATNEFLTGWQEIDGKRYYLTDDGTTLKGWQTVDDERHYFELDGSMPVGWVTDTEGITYWVKPEDGTLASHEWIEIDGVYQAFDDDGSWVSPGDVRPPGEEERMANLSERQRAVIESCDSTPWPGAALCAGWVSNVFENAGEGLVGGDACDMARAWCVLDDLSALEPGMLVAVPSHSRTENGKIWGHVGIYVGGGIVCDSGSYAVRRCSLGSWLAWFGVSEAPRWGWAHGRSLA